MNRYIISRMVQFLPLLLLITIFSYALIRLAPGDPTTFFISPKVRPEERQRIRENLGLNRPLPIQYAIWLKNLITRGNLGYSMINGRPVSETILERLPYTVALMGTAYLLALLIAIPMGIMGAVRRGGGLDFSFTIAAFVGISIPSFWLGLVAIYLLTLKWGLLPSVGMGSGVSGSLFSQIADAAHHLIAPVLVLVIASFGFWSRYVRGGLRSSCLQKCPAPSCEPAGTLFA
ncbi:MAG: ABC transporter permease [Armatimonadetes bacterium]|nr:ABC transporter permease [Armatimonadota bacterium]